jgi:hypothetical protein
MQLLSFTCSPSSASQLRRSGSTTQPKRALEFWPSQVGAPWLPSFTSPCACGSRLLPSGVSQSVMIGRCMSCGVSAYQRLSPGYDGLSFHWSAWPFSSSLSPPRELWLPWVFRRMHVTAQRIPWTVTRRRDQGFSIGGCLVLIVRFGVPVS